MARSWPNQAAVAAKATQDHSTVISAWRERSDMVNPLLVPHHAAAAPRSKSKAIGTGLRPLSRKSRTSSSSSSP
jgi:hypothetical protein